MSGSGALTVADLPSHAHAVGVPGDFNFNGVVDAADYVVWCKSLGTQGDYNMWRTNFGKSLGRGMSGESNLDIAVAEPATAVLGVMAVGAIFLRWGRSAQDLRCSLATTAN